MLPVSCQMEKSLQAKASQNGGRALANDTSVTSDLDLIGSLGDRSRNIDHLLAISSDCGSKSSVGGDGSGSTTCATGGTSVLAGITEGCVASSGALIKRVDDLIAGRSWDSQCEAGQTADRDSGQNLVQRHLERRSRKTKAFKSGS